MSVEDKFLEDLSGRYAKPYEEAIGRLLAAVAMGNKPQAASARAALGETMADTMQMAELLGASLTLKAAAATLTAPEARTDGLFTATPLAMLRFASSNQTIVPNVTFEDAVQSMVDRTPVTLVDAAERTSQAIARVYSKGAHVAFVRAAEHAVTERVQSLIVQAMREGIVETGAGDLIRMGVREVAEQTADWSHGYAKMVFRTNANTAITAGRFRATRDESIQKVIPCFRFDTAHDVDVRSNHARANGIIMRTDNQQWTKIAPPLGYNCRCGLGYVPITMLRRLGRVRSDGSIVEDRVPSGAAADSGFRHGGRPDIFLGGV